MEASNQKNKQPASGVGSALQTPRQAAARRNKRKATISPYAKGDVKDARAIVMDALDIYETENAKLQKSVLSLEQTNAKLTTDLADSNLKIRLLETKCDRSSAFEEKISKLTVDLANCHLKVRLLETQNVKLTSQNKKLVDMLKGIRAQIPSQLDTDQCF